MGSKFYKKIYTIIKITVGTEGAEWQEIVSAIKKDGLNVKNWMTVRGVLQDMINKNIIVRTNSVVIEKYVPA